MTYTMVRSNGILTVTLKTWADFYEIVHESLGPLRPYVWRGQMNADWRVHSALDRIAARVGRVDAEFRKQHLDNFKVAARGRRGLNPPPISGDNEWWALGQHYGLATPLLDWTSSPFVAAYFAFWEDDPHVNNRAVYGLQEVRVTARSRELGPDQQIKFIRPNTDENPRILSQAGLFTHLPDNDDLQAWVQRHYAADEANTILTKIVIPNGERDVALKELNRMNINHLSLFPDLQGASLYCNLHCLLSEY